MSSWCVAARVRTRKTGQVSQSTTTGHTHTHTHSVTKRVLETQIDTAREKRSINTQADIQTEGKTWFNNTSKRTEMVLPLQHLTFTQSLLPPHKHSTEPFNPSQLSCTSFSLSSGQTQTLTTQPKRTHPPDEEGGRTESDQTKGNPTQERKTYRHRHTQTETQPVIQISSVNHYIRLIINTNKLTMGLKERRSERGRGTEEETAIVCEREEATLLTRSQPSLRVLSESSSSSESFFFTDFPIQLRKLLTTRNTSHPPNNGIITHTHTTATVNLSLSLSPSVCRPLSTLQHTSIFP